MQKSRSFEPTAQDGGETYVMLSSCLRVARVEASLLLRQGTCSIASEMCCQTTPKQRVARFWSLATPAAQHGAHSRAGFADTLVSNSEAEVRRLNGSEARGDSVSYDQLCNPFGSPTALAPARTTFVPTRLCRTPRTHRVPKATLLSAAARLSPGPTTQGQLLLQAPCHSTAALTTPAAIC